MNKGFPMAVKRNTEVFAFIPDTNSKPNVGRQIADEDGGCPYSG